MDDTICYAYSKRNSFITIAVLFVLALLFILNIFKAYHTNDQIDMIVFAVLTVVLGFMLIILIISRLRPALKGDTVLEFNENNIIDYLRNITVGWKDIKQIDFKRTRSSAMLVVNLRWESDYGSIIYISLRWVAGNDHEIYITALAHLAKFSGAIN